MKLGFCSISALDRSLADAARLAAEAGADGMEITERPPHLAPGASVEDAAEAGRVVRAAGLEVIAFGSYLGKESAPTREAAHRAVESAAAMGAPLLRVWAEPTDRVDDRDRVVSVLAEACDVAAPHDIDVVVERHVGSYADTAQRVEALLRDVDRPNFALNYQVLDFLPSEALPDQPADAERLVGHARYFHLKNYRPGQAGGPLLPGGDLEGGEVDYRALLAAAIGAGYAGPFTLEFVAWDARPLEEKVAADLRHARGLIEELGE